MPTLFPGESANIRKLARNCLLFSLVWHIIAAWFSTGYHLYDEHFSILEFTGYKLGITPASSLSWEFKAQLRQGLQPWVVYSIMKLMGAHANPFVCSFIVRLIATLLGWCSLVILLVIGLKWMKNENAKRFFILATSLLWFFPYLHTRFSAESVSGSLFFIGLGFTWLAAPKSSREIGTSSKGDFKIATHRRDYFLLFAGGFLMGLAFVCRYQTGFMIVGIATWCIFIARFSVSKILMLVSAASAAIVIGVLADHWFYGEWVSTAWTYYKINLVQGKASEFGVSPLWGYFPRLSLDLIPPFSIFIMAGILFAFYKFPKNIISLSFIPFLLIHFIIAHKEPRFLFPLVSGVPVLLALAYGELNTKYFDGKKGWSIFIKVFWGINLLLLAISSLKPASGQFGLYGYIYEHYNGKSAILVSKERQPYHLVDFMLYFHKTRDITLVDHASNATLDSIASATTTRPVLMLFESQKDGDDFQRTHPSARLIYTNTPSWLYAFNFGDWISRSHVWLLYEVKGESKN